MKIYVINLKESVDKKSHINELADKYQIDFEYFAAIDGRKMTDEEIALGYDHKGALENIQRPLGKGEIGCALSHLKLAKQQVENSLRYQCILEDDVLFDSRLQDLDILAEGVPDDADIIFLGHYSDHLHSPVNASFWGRLQTECGMLKRPCQPILGTHAYILTLKGALKLVESYGNGVHKPVDHITGDMKLMKVYLLCPEMVTLDPVLLQKSSIEEERNTLHLRHSRVGKNYKQYLKKNVCVRWALCGKKKIINFCKAIQPLGR